MKRDWKRERAQAAKHARLMQRRPELRQALYGHAPPDRPTPDQSQSGSRETAQRKE